MSPPRQDVAKGGDPGAGHFRTESWECQLRGIDVCAEKIKEFLEFGVAGALLYKPIRAVGTAFAVGAMVSTLLSSCTTIVADVSLIRIVAAPACYAPRYEGPTVVCEVVSPPSGWNP